VVAPRRDWVGQAFVVLNIETHDEFVRGGMSGSPMVNAGGEAVSAGVGDAETPRYRTQRVL
jgi:hypothetical protein